MSVLIAAQYHPSGRGPVASRLLGNTPIWPDLKRVLGNTLQLIILAEILAVSLAIVVGVISAAKQYSVFDYGATTMSFVGFSTPVFWFALILQVIFTNIYLNYGVRIFYTSQLSSSNPENPDAAPAQACEGYSGTNASGRTGSISCSTTVPGTATSSPG